MTDEQPTVPFLNERDVRDQERRAQQMGDEIRRYLLAVNTLAIGAVLVLLRTLEGAAEKWIALAALLFSWGKPTGWARSWFRGKLAAMSRRENAKKGIGRYPW